MAWNLEYYLAIKKERELAICNNRDEPRGYNSRWDKSDRAREMPYNFTHLWNLGNKTNQIDKKDGLLNTEYKLVVARGEVAGHMGEINKED